VEADTLIEIPIGFSVAMSCVMGNRLLLNTREVVRETKLDDNLLARTVDFHYMLWQREISD